MRNEWGKAKKNFPESIKAMRLHDCRHICASLLAAQGATDVELAAQLTALHVRDGGAIQPPSRRAPWHRAQQAGRSIWETVTGRARLRAWAIRPLMPTAFS